MKRCSVKPYEGTEKYIFVSYCHRDFARVFPIIEQLAKDGHRVWYDEGIDPGSEWPEIIAKHLNGSSICLAFVSENSLNSHNCRREINFALLKKKYFISIILEPVQMSLGMEMQLSASQSIFKYKMPSENEFFTKLYEASELKKCQGEPNYSIVVSSSDDYNKDSCDTDKVRDPFSDRWFVMSDKTADEANQRNNQEEERRRKAEEAARRAAEEEERRRKAEEAARKAAEEEECCRKAEEAARRAAEEEERRRKAENSISYILKREKTNEIIQINKPEFILGRSENKSDYVIHNNHSVSRCHAILTFLNGICYITDNHSLNKTFLNGIELDPDKHYELHNGDSIRICNEKFTYLQI